MVETTWGLEVRVLNISRSGILVESSAKFDGDKPARFRLHGPDAPLVVPARIVRTEIAEVDRRGVRYQVAAVFERGLDLFPERPDLPKSGPAALAELLVRVTAEMGRDQQRARGLFEQGLLQLVAAREIRISEALAVPPAGYESVYFTVPDSRGRRTILQAVFERDHEPAAEEFRMLKAAAAAAAVVLLYERERPLLVAKSA